MIILGGVVLSLVATAVDDGTLILQSIAGDPAAASQILYLIAFAMLTLCEPGARGFASSDDSRTGWPTSGWPVAWSLR